MSVKFKGNPVVLSAHTIKVGDKAPVVELVGKDLSSITIGGAKDEYQIINVVPSLDTGVCATQARRFNQEAAKISNAKVYVVSMDLPFAQGRFCTTEGIENLVVLSDFVDKTFGKAYGLLLQSGPLKGLLTRSVIVINPQGEVIYTEVCEEITNEPHYDNALNAIK
ncbi:thiol peroxidase [Helicobacter sp. MIT 05-5293]|uniref:Thiol peroxidase n=1 Tax=uncultured Helicobacter sp. TaxID=175537 RepID=A0A650ELE4_9HELI|nr:thiol peroxidase [Helicobacter sp. MIT 05-5293]QGT50443.1 putative thiol peroxidase [uncultured Helicobacter sp.]TLD82138.1 thiol peroxidase [Helicobacter sp. MIT 05-5293]